MSNSVPNKSSDNIALIALLGAGVLWGFMSVFVKWMSACGLTLQQMVLTRSLFAAIMLGSFLAVKKPSKLLVRIKDIWIFIGTGILSLFCFNLCYFYVIARGYAAIGGVLLYTSPVFIIILSALLFKEKITTLKIAGLVLTLLGCFLVSGLLGSNQRLPLNILLSGIGSGFFYALYSIFGKFAVKRYDALTITFYTFVFCAIAIICMGELPGTLRAFKSVPRALLPCCGNAFFCALLPYFLYTWGLLRTTAGRAAILVAVEPIVCTILGIFIYKEPTSSLQITGIIAIMLAIILQCKSDQKNDASKSVAVSSDSTDTTH